MQTQFRPSLPTRLVTFFVLLILQRLPSYLSDDGTCTLKQNANAQESSTGCDPALQPMIVDVGSNGEQNTTFLAYATPDVSTFYQEEVGTRSAKDPTFVSFTGKFINMSPEAVRLFWDPDDGRDAVYIGDAGPFESCGTATFPSHKFFFTPQFQTETKLASFTMVKESCVYVYDPFDKSTYRATQTPPSTPLSLDSLNTKQLNKYYIHKRNLVFAMQYREVTGRDWLAVYGRRERPMHKMWSADYFGQQHWVETAETHFTSLPPEVELKKVSPARRLDTEPLPLDSYRAPGSLNLTLTTLSCAPRAFEIKNFLSEVEIDHIMELATGMTLSQSVTRGGSEGSASGVPDTRTSRNTWVYRSKSPIVDGIYRRAADVLGIDEALLRRRTKDEYSDLGSVGSLAEPLQLVHYNVGQEYTAHHDFHFPRLEGRQQARFATLLLYLNEPEEGGETSFPRWINSESRTGLNVTPEKGKAVLFYSLLPDGNMDDLSQHAALPVKRGEKWLMNLWVWDPIYS